MATWLLSDEARDDMRAWQNNTIDVTEETMAVARDRMSGLLNVKGNVGEIEVKGVLTKDFDLRAALFGGGNTTYSDIQASLAAADADPNVSDITMYFDSPGGNVSGMFDTVNAMQQTSKPISAVIDMAASAAYALASQADTMIAKHQGTMVGSVGIISGTPVKADYVVTTSTNAPNKQPDPTTEEGQAVIRAHLDGIHDLFVDAIADGRGTTAANINANYGRGGVVLAKQALAAGMIDSIMSSPRRQANKTAASSGTEVSKMDLTQLKTEHLAVYEAVVAIGMQAEKDRCEAHLTLAEACGCVDEAIKAIRSGDEFSTKYQALYMAAGVRKDTLNARVKDNPDVGTPVVTEDLTEAQAEAKRIDDETEMLLFGNVEAHNG